MWIPEDWLEELLMIILTACGITVVIFASVLVGTLLANGLCQ